MNGLKIYIEGYGCTLNTADTNIIKNSIATFEDFQIVQNPEDADIIVINTCAVRLETEHRMISRIEHFKSLNKKVIVAGCMPKALKEKVEDKGDVLVMPKEAHLSGNIIHEYVIHNRYNPCNNSSSINLMSISTFGLSKIPSSYALLFMASKELVISSLNAYFQSPP